MENELIYDTIEEAQKVCDEINSKGTIKGVNIGLAYWKPESIPIAEVIEFENKYKVIL